MLLNDETNKPFKCFSALHNYQFRTWLQSLSLNAALEEYL